MSQAKPLTNDLRETHYLADGRTDLTPRQARRSRHKLNTALSPRVVAGVGRYGRLGRRFDRKDRARLRTEARGFVATVRALRSGWRPGPRGGDSQ